MATLQKGSKIYARGDSNVNVLDFPLGNGNVLKTFAPFEAVGYALDDITYSDTTGNDISQFIEVLYFNSNNPFVPVAVGYVDIDSVDISDPEPNSTTAPVTDENGTTLEESERPNGVVVKDPETGKTTVIVPKESPAATMQNGPFPTWAKYTIIGIAVVLTIVSGVWIYGQYKKNQKGKK